LSPMEYLGREACLIRYSPHHDVNQRACSSAEVPGLGARALRLGVLAPLAAAACQSGPVARLKRPKLRLRLGRDLAATRKLAPGPGVATRGDGR
jgi:hypothetical protein